MRKVLLVNPPGVVYLFPDGRPAHRKHCAPTLGLAYLAASLLKNGFEVEVLDILAEGYSHEEVRKEQNVLVYGLPTQEVIERVKKANPDLIGMSVLFSSAAPEAHRISKALKDAFPGLPIVWGGQHPTGAPFEVMKDPHIDYVLLGESDLSFVALLHALNGKMPLPAVTGLVYRDGNDVKSTLAGVTPMFEGKGFNYYLAKDYGIPMKLDELPRPAWSLFHARI